MPIWHRAGWSGALLWAHLAHGKAGSIPPYRGGISKSGFTVLGSHRMSCSNGNTTIAKVHELHVPGPFHVQGHSRSHTSQKAGTSLVFQRCEN